MGAAVEGTVTSLPKFGAFVQLAEGVEGLVHISEITAEKRLNHPQEVLKVGQTVKAQILALDIEKRLIRLSMKQLVPTDIDEYLAEHNVGDVVTGRVVKSRVTTAQRKSNLAMAFTGHVFRQQIQRLRQSSSAAAVLRGTLSTMSSMLMARWKGGAGGESPKSSLLQPGQIRQFRITRLDRDAKVIEVVPG